MTLLGLDFDNTLVRYDKLFYQLALEKGLIQESLPADKLAIRDFLRSQGRDEEFTLLQGEVYGKRILDADPAVGMLESLIALKAAGIPMVLISHKTKFPFKGPLYDLHQAALDWLGKYGFFSPQGIGWIPSQIYFEESKELKVTRIRSLGCTHYVDDLPEILSMIPHSIHGILYDPCGSHAIKSYQKFSDWSNFSNIFFQAH